MLILAVVVTHNRARELMRCLDHIESQTLKPDDLIVINNGSTDDTVELLRARGVACITQANLGSAGGWHSGIEHALTNGYDAVWMMDDDGYPDHSALAELVPRLGNGVACVSSVVMREESPRHFVFPFPILDSEGMPITIACRRKLGTIEELEKIAEDGVYRFAHLFNGALIPCRVIKDVGNVEIEYFMFGDDVDYFMRLRKHGLVLSVLSARHMHPDVSARPLSEIKLYFYIKNTIILNGRYFNQVALRNALAVVAGVGRIALRNGPGVAANYLVGARAAVLWRAILRGLRGETGNDYAR